MSFGSSGLVNGWFCNAFPLALVLPVSCAIKKSAAVGGVGVDVYKIAVLWTGGLWAPQTLQAGIGVEVP